MPLEGPLYKRKTPSRYKGVFNLQTNVFSLGFLEGWVIKVELEDLFILTPRSIIKCQLAKFECIVSSLGTSWCFIWYEKSVQNRVHLKEIELVHLLPFQLVYYRNIRLHSIVVRVSRPSYDHLNRYP